MSSCLENLSSGNGAGFNNARQRDAAGNLTYDGMHKFTYDAWNRLVTVSKAWRQSGGSLGVGSVFATMGYDAAGRRVRKAVNETGAWDCTYWVCQDANYNVLGVVDGSGVLKERYEYTPYGQRTVFFSSGSNDVGCYSPTWSSRRVVSSGTPQPYGLCEFGHQGLMHDEESGLVHNRARVLNPPLCRFLQRDPLGYVESMGLYEYVRSKPAIRRDPLGLGEVALPPSAVAEAGGLMVELGAWYAKYKAVFYLGAALTAQQIGQSQNAMFQVKLTLQNIGLPDQVISQWARDAQKSLDELWEKVKAKADTKDPPPAVEKCRRCRPCVPAVGEIAKRTDFVPPSEPHAPYKGTHSHLYKMNQSPPPACRCFWVEFGLVDGVADYPEIVPASGGGLE